MKVILSVCYTLICRKHLTLCVLLEKLKCFGISGYSRYSLLTIGSVTICLTENSFVW